MTALLDVQRAAGAVLRGARRNGTPLRPALAIDALLSAMRALFGLADQDADRLLRPALADWRDAVGCADLLLLPANAQRPQGDKHLVPLPMPSWCAWLIEAGVLLLEGAPSLDGPRVVQPARLLVVREAELTAVESFPVLFAGRYGAASLQVHLALSPPFLDGGWRGTVCLRAAAERPGAVPRLWLGAPAAPSRDGPAGTHGETVVTWTCASTGAAAVSDTWPSGWPRWAVLRLLEGREPQALWDLAALWRAREGAAAGSVRSTTAGKMRLSVDLGSTSTVVVEEDSATAGSVGAKLLGPRAPLSGFRLLAGDPVTAHRFGCAEQLVAPGGQLPTALVAATPEALAEVLSGQAPPEQLWLLQGPEAKGVLVDRFKSPALLPLSDWLADLPGASSLDRSQLSRRLLETYAYLLGRTLAAAHGAPLVTPEGGGWTLRSPRLASVEAVLTCPQCPFDSAGTEPFARVFEQVAGQLCRGLSAAWDNTAHRLVPDPVAAEAARDRPQDADHPIEAFVDFGGLTLQISVRVPRARGRPAPFIAASSMSYLLGGERLIDSAAFAGAGLLREGFRAAYCSMARRWRALIAAGGHLREHESGLLAAVRESILSTVLALVRRQLEGTLRRAAPDLSGLRGAGLRLYLLGEGWKLVALDAPDERREAEMLARVTQSLAAKPLLPGVGLQVQRLTKRRVCEGALRVHAGAEVASEAVELQGVDVSAADGLRQRWFGVVETGALSGPDLLPDAQDPWWREFGGAEGSLLRVEQWFATDGSPFETHLAGGNLAFDPGSSFLKQWLDVCGPSLMALRIHDRLSA